MSRIGRKPVTVPASVKVSIADSTIQVEGPKGKLSIHAIGSRSAWPSTRPASRFWSPVPTTSAKIALCTA